MDVNHEQWEAYEAAFRNLAEVAEKVARPEPTLDSCQYYLCLYGENGLSVEEEFQLLTKLSAEAGNHLKKIEVETDIWQDIILFVP